MPALNELQQTTLKGMRGYRVLFQFTTGELAAAPDHKYELAKVIDLDGKVYPYSWYMAGRKQKASFPDTWTDT